MRKYHFAVLSVAPELWHGYGQMLIDALPPGVHLDDVTADWEDTEGVLFRLWCADFPGIASGQPGTRLKGKLGLLHDGTPRWELTWGE